MVTCSRCRRGDVVDIFFKRRRSKTMVSVRGRSYRVLIGPESRTMRNIYIFPGDFSFVVTELNRLTICKEKKKCKLLSPHRTRVKSRNSIEPHQCLFVVRLPKMKLTECKKLLKMTINYGTRSEPLELLNLKIMKRKTENHM